MGGGGENSRKYPRLFSLILRYYPVLVIVTLSLIFVIQKFPICAKLYSSLVHMPPDKKKVL